MRMPGYLAGMHEFQHVITGDSATGSIKQALGITEGDILRQNDDLSIGPLGDVHMKSVSLRAAFWRKVYGASAADWEAGLGRRLEDDLAAIAGRFHRLADDPRPCLVWYGTGANEQITPRLAAHFLKGTPKEMWVAKALLEDWKGLPPRQAVAVAICNPPRLLE